MADWGAIERMMAIKNLTPQTLVAEEFAEKRDYFARARSAAIRSSARPTRSPRNSPTLSRGGMRGIAVSMVNYLDELPFFRDEVLPRLERLGVRAKN